MVAPDQLFCFFLLQIVAAPAAPDHMYLEVVVQPHITYRRPKLTFHLF